MADANTIIAYDNNATTITDPDGFFKSASVSIKPVNNKIEVDYEITFSNPMDTSNLIIRTWDKSDYKTDKQILDAFKVVDSISSKKDNSTFSDLLTTNSPTLDIDKPLNSPDDTPFIPVWVKNNAKWWADGDISDVEFVQAIQYMINHEIVSATGNNSHLVADDASR